MHHQCSALLIIPHFFFKFPITYGNSIWSKRPGRIENIYSQRDRAAAAALRQFRSRVEARASRACLTDSLARARALRLINENFRLFICASGMGRFKNVIIRIFGTSSAEIKFTRRPVYLLFVIIDCPGALWEWHFNCEKGFGLLSTFPSTSFFSPQRTFRTYSQACDSCSFLTYIHIWSQQTYYFLWIKWLFHCAFIPHFILINLVLLPL